MSQENFWADEIVDEIVKTKNTFIVSTGITPSGPIHIGNMREVLTGDIVYRILKERNKTVTFNYVADDNDALRRVYPFLDSSYEAHVGKPLNKVPCPCKQHTSYAEHFLLPFFASLKKLGIEAEILRASALYAKGRMNKAVIEPLKKTESIKKILNDETGKETDEEWSPYLPLCSHCGKNNTTKLTGFSEKDETITYVCTCGDTRTVPIAGNGKLTWRIDWPARWSVLGVTIEPFGKDHATDGGSYDTGKRIVQEVFGKEPPFPIVYEWISLKGQGDMSSSKGNVVTIDEMLEVVPPEVLRYMIFKTQPKKAFVFDPGLPIFNLINEYDDGESNKNERAYHLSKLKEISSVGVPYKHMVTLVQMTNNNFNLIKDILKRTGYTNFHETELESRAHYAFSWVKKFAPDEVKFELKKTLPDEAKHLNDNQKKILEELRGKLTIDLNGEAIHNLLYTIIQTIGASPKEGFEAIYLIFLGKTRGPKAGWFLESLGHEFVMKRLGEIA